MRRDESFSGRGSATREGEQATTREVREDGVQGTRRVGEGSNVIQIAGNLSQNQLGSRRPERFWSSITGLCVGIGDRAILNKRGIGGVGE